MSRETEIRICAITAYDLLGRTSRDEVAEELLVAGYDDEEIEECIDELFADGSLEGDDREAAPTARAAAQAILATVPSNRHTAHTVPTVATSGGTSTNSLASDLTAAPPNASVVTAATPPKE